MIIISNKRASANADEKKLTISNKYNNVSNFCCLKSN